jgi:hypothetical protein
VIPVPRVFEIVTVRELVVVFRVCVPESAVSRGEIPERTVTGVSFDPNSFVAITVIVTVESTVPCAIVTLTDVSVCSVSVTPASGGSYDQVIPVPRPF